MQVPMREKKHDNGHRVSTGPPLRYIKAATEYFYGSPDHNFLDNWGTVFYIRSCLSLVQCLARNNFPGNLFNADRQRFKNKKTKNLHSSSEREFAQQIYFQSTFVSNQWLAKAVQLYDQQRHRRSNLSCCSGTSLSNSSQHDGLSWKIFRKTRAFLSHLCKHIRNI